MRRDEALRFLKEVTQTEVPLLPRKGWVDAVTKEQEYEYDLHPATAWITEAETAIRAVFPERHSVTRRWAAIMQDKAIVRDKGTFDALRAVASKAYDLVRDGRISTLIAGVRAETETELLDQAEALHQGDYLAAAAVLAGGALETQLQGLCQEYGLTVHGHGSIEKYNNAIASARKAGKNVYPLADGKSVTAWGDRRNSAAHDPGSFQATTTANEVRLMIDGVRGFIERVSQSGH